MAQIAGLRLARNRLQRGELTAADLVELQDQERETLTELRELARGIHPPVLSDNGLVAAVESGVARFPIPLTVEADERLRTERFAEDVETTAYYVVREALANTAKHANATHASVGLAHEGRAPADRDHGRRMRHPQRREARGDERRPREHPRSRCRIARHDARFDRISRRARQCSWTCRSNERRQRVG